MSLSPSTIATSISEETRYPSIACWLVLALVFLLCYGTTLRGLAMDWWTDPDYSFGLVTPVAIAYVVFGRRQSLRDTPLAPSTRAGLALVALSQLIFLAGYAAAEFFLQRSSMVVLFAGIILSVVGWGWLKRLVLPLCLLELAIPLPTVLLQSISMPLQLVASWGAEMLLRLIGLSVYRSGNILQLPHQLLNVSQACSGLRSLACLVALALVLVSLSRLQSWSRMLFVASAACVAILANALRVTGTGILSQYAGRSSIQGLWHSFEGWFVFVLSFLLLSAELLYLQRILTPSRPEGGQ